MASEAHAGVRPHPGPPLTPTGVIPLNHAAGADRPTTGTAPFRITQSMPAGSRHQHLPARRTDTMRLRRPEAGGAASGDPAVAAGRVGHCDDPAGAARRSAHRRAEPAALSHLSSGAATIGAAFPADGYFRNSRGAKSFRQRRQVSHSWAVPADSKYTFLIPAFVRASLKFFVPGPSAVPIPRKRTLTF